MDCNIMKIQPYLQHLYDKGTVLIPSNLVGELQVELAALKVNYKIKLIGDIYQFEVEQWK